MTDDIITTFTRILEAENAISAAKKELAEAEARLKPIISAEETKRDKAWAEIQAHMAETGEYEIILPHDSMANWRIYPTTPRESVVGDADAAPDEFVTRSLKKAEVAKHLKALRDAGADQPNWARLELGESKLTYKLEKAK